MKWLHSCDRIKCPFCTYKAPVRKQLTLHIRTQHTHRDYKPYGCPYCEFKSRSSQNCRKHVVQRHKDQEVRWIKLCNITANDVHRAINSAIGCGKEDGIEGGTTTMVGEGQERTGIGRNEDIDSVRLISTDKMSEQTKENSGALSTSTGVITNAECATTDQANNLSGFEQSIVSHTVGVGSSFCPDTARNMYLSHIPASQQGGLATIAVSQLEGFDPSVLSWSALPDAVNTSSGSSHLDSSVTTQTMTTSGSTVTSQPDYPGKYILDGGSIRPTTGQHMASHFQPVGNEKPDYNIEQLVVLPLERQTANINNYRYDKYLGSHDQSEEDKFNVYLYHRSNQRFQQESLITKKKL